MTLIFIENCNAKCYNPLMVNDTKQAIICDIIVRRLRHNLDYFEVIGFELIWLFKDSII